MLVHVTCKYGRVKNATGKYRYFVLYSEHFKKSA